MLSSHVGPSVKLYEAVLCIQDHILLKKYLPWSSTKLPHDCYSKRSAHSIKTLGLIPERQSRDSSKKTTLPSLGRLFDILCEVLTAKSDVLL